MVLLVWMAGCTDKGDDSGSAEGWTTVVEDADNAFLSITGSSATDVYAVGADPGTGPGVVHYDGSSWTTLATGSTGDLWWVTRVGADSLWMGGADGRVLHYVPSTNTFTEAVTDSSITVFGLWGASDTEVWAVGGDINATSAGAAIWRWDGKAWTEMSLPEDAANEIAVYKIWGRASDDIYAVGTGGIGLHWDGKAWSSLTTGTTSSLFTVSGSATETWAVGGAFSGTIVHESGGTWSDETPSLAPQFNGIDATGSAPVAVGISGAVYERTGGAWSADPRGAVTLYDLHGVWVDPDGGIWTVGGKLSSFPLDHGIMAYGGEADVPAL
jgi:hypothetical protein